MIIKLELQCNRQKGSWERGYYVMHWMRTITRVAIMNSWEHVSYSFISL